LFVRGRIAIEKVDEALNQAKRNNEDELKIIVGTFVDPTSRKARGIPQYRLILRRSHSVVGKGIHSQGHVAKIKPAVEDMMVK